MHGKRRERKYETAIDQKFSIFHGKRYCGTKENKVISDE